VGNSPPLLVLWGDTPHAPLPWGLCPPAPPILPALVGLGFARVLGPTHGGVANAGYSPPLLNLGGTPPNPPAMGAPPPWTPVLPTLVGLGLASVLGPTQSGFARG